MIRVLLVDDETLVRAGMRRYIDDFADMDVVGEAADGSEAVDAVLRHRPHVVLMDVRMPRMDGLAATRAIRALDDPPEVIVLTTFKVDEYIVEALRAGANGFFYKHVSADELERGIRTVVAGGSILDPMAARVAIGEIVADSRADRRAAAAARFAELTSRELEVVRQLAAGLSNADIAAALHMSEATVKSHISRIFVKVDVENRTALALEAATAGISPDT